MIDISGVRQGRVPRFSYSIQQLQRPRSDLLPTTDVYFRGWRWPSYSRERIHRCAATPSSWRNAESCRSPTWVACPYFVCRSHAHWLLRPCADVLDGGLAARTYTINLAADLGSATGAVGHIYRYYPDGPRVQNYNLGSTGSLSRASTPNTHSWTRRSGS